MYVFYVQALRSDRLSSLDFNLWGHWNPPSVFSSNWIWRDTFPARILWLSNHSQPPRELYKDARKYIGSGGGHFERFFVKCDLMHSKNLTHIKLETCTVNVLCQLWVKHCIIQEYIVERNLAIKLKDRSFPYCLCEMFALYCVKNLLLKFVQAFCMDPVCCHNFSSFFVRRKFVDVKLSLYLILGDFFGVFLQNAQIPGVRSLGRINFLRRRQCLWVLSIDRASCHPSGGRNFEVASTILKKLCPNVLRNKSKFACLNNYLNIETE